jgi:hypothetical protein
MNHTEADLHTIHEAAQQSRVHGRIIRRWIQWGAMNAITLPHKEMRHISRIPQIALGALLALGRSNEGTERRFS